MNERQVEYFRQKLLNWKEDILRESRETSPTCRARLKIILTWPTGLRRRLTGRLSCAPVTANAS